MNIISAIKVNPVSCHCGRVHCVDRRTNRAIPNTAVLMDWLIKKDNPVLLWALAWLLWLKRHTFINVARPWMWQVSWWMGHIGDSLLHMIVIVIVIMIIMLLCTTKSNVSINRLCKSTMHWTYIPVRDFLNSFRYFRIEILRKFE